MMSKLERYDKSIELLNTKLDKIIDVLNDNKIELTRQHHDLYGNGKQGLFDSFTDLKKQVGKNSKYIWGGGLVTSFIAFIPILKEFVKGLIK